VKQGSQKSQQGDFYHREALQNQYQHCLPGIGGTGLLSTNYTFLGGGLSLRELTQHGQALLPWTEWAAQEESFRQGEKYKPEGTHQGHR
jgi:hypothetical protein